MATPMIDETISAITPDWSRETWRRLRWNPSQALLMSIRDYQRRKNAGAFAILLVGAAILRHRFWSAITGADIPLNCQIGGGLLIPHPNGIVIHPDSRIGPNCLFFQQVTIGSNRRGCPTIGGHVDIGAGAKILGPVTIGDNAVIGANAAVLTDVPANAVAIGIPARIILDVDRAA